MQDWPEIMDREGPAVWRTVYRILGNRADAEECYQEVFLAALKVASVQTVQCWRALLQSLATRRGLDRLRQRCRRAAREVAVDWESLHSDVPTPSQTLEDNEFLVQVREALAQLPAKQSEVFCLHCLEGWSYQEIARHLQTPVDTVGVLLHRARQKLRELVPAISS